MTEKIIPLPAKRWHQTKMIQKEAGFSIFEADTRWMELRKEYLLTQALRMNNEGRPQDAVTVLVECLRLKRAARG